MSQLLNNFKKHGVVHIKNFFTDQEINLLSARAKEATKSEFEFLYLINNEKINNSFLSKSKFKPLKNEILELCNGKELKIKALEDFIVFFQPILKKHNLEDFYLEELHGVFNENHMTPQDVFADNIYSSIFFTDKVLNIYKELLESNDLVYHGEGHVSYNKSSRQNWHTDDLPNYAKNTSEKTFQIRGGIFYHSDEKNSGGIKFLLGSHYYIRPSKLIKKFIKKIFLKKNFNNSIFNTRILFGKNFFPGHRDFILWDKRIIHSPWGVKIKKFPKLCLSPSIEKYFFRGSFPRSLAEKNPFPRSLASLDMGRNSKSLDTFIEFLSKREDYKVYFKTKSKLLSEEFVSKLAAKNVYFNDSCVRKWQN
jgi:hypothetical protein